MSDLSKTLRVADRNVGINALLEGKAVRLGEFSDTGVPLARFIPHAKSDADHLRPDYRHVRKIEVLAEWHNKNTRAASLRECSGACV